MTSSIDPRLAREALLQVRSRKDRLIAGIKSMFEQRKIKRQGKKYRRDLGLDSWDGFAWAEQMQDDGQRVKREWDSAKKEWVVVPNLGSERSVSPCDMRQRVIEEEKDTRVGRGGEEDSFHDSFYAAPTSVGSPVEIDAGIRSISEPAVDDVTIRPSMLAAGQSDGRLGPEERRDSDATIRPDVTAVDDSINLVQPIVQTTGNNAKLGRPSLTATKKHVSLRRAAIWNAACRKGLDFWKFGSQDSPEAGNEPNDAEEPLLTTSKSKNSSLPAKPSKSDLDGLSKLINSIDAERVNSVRHIWHEDTHTWSHERTAGT